MTWAGSRFPAHEHMPATHVCVHAKNTHTQNKTPHLETNKPNKSTRLAPYGRNTVGESDVVSVNDHHCICVEQNKPKETQNTAIDSTTAVDVRRVCNSALPDPAPTCLWISAKLHTLF